MITINLWRELIDDYSGPIMYLTATIVSLLSLPLDILLLPLEIISFIIYTIVERRKK